MKITQKVTVCEKLGLVVQQLFVGLYSKLEVWTFHDGIDWASFLAKPTVDALCHVDVVSGRPPEQRLLRGQSIKHCTTAPQKSGNPQQSVPAAVCAWFSFDCDGLSRADGFAQLASNASLLS